MPVIEKLASRQVDLAHTATTTSIYGKIKTLDKMSIGDTIKYAKGQKKDGLYDPKRKVETVFLAPVKPKLPFYLISTLRVDNSSQRNKAQLKTAIQKLYTKCKGESERECFKAYKEKVSKLCLGIWAYRWNRE